MNTNELQKLAIEAFIYGFPMIYNLEQVQTYVIKGIGANKAAPFNTFSHAESLASPADKFVTINNDTIYSFAQIDLSVGPLILRVPETGNRYYVLQFIDAWTNNFAYVGQRATGNGEGNFFLTPPNWSGEVPADHIQIKFPTRIATIAGRWACDGVQDIPNVIALQKEVQLLQVNPDAKPIGIPVYDTSVSEELLFFEKLRTFMADLVPADIFISIQEAFAPLGLLALGDSPYKTVDDTLKTALIAAKAEGLKFVDNMMKNSGNEVENGWNLVFTAFDYNTSFFEVGAIDEPRFILAHATPEKLSILIVKRAAAALGGLWGNHAYEAAYTMNYVDSEGELLNGANTYTLTLDPTPPVGAFWSLTMYDIPTFFLVENSINRYSVGDRTPGLQYEDDGSLVITVSANEPTDSKARANWLPAPNANFRPVLRLYLPKEDVFKRTYHFPAFVKR